MGTKYAVESAIPAVANISFIDLPFTPTMPVALVAFPSTIHESCHVSEEWISSEEPSFFFNFVVEEPGI